MSELEVALATLFRRKAGLGQTEKELMHAMTFDLRWFGATEAKAMLDAALDENLLKKDGEKIKPNFDIKGVSLPIMYTPSEKFVSELRSYKSKVENKDNQNNLDSQKNEKNEKIPVFRKILSRISEKTGLAKTDIMREINRKKERLNMDIEVVGLIIAKKHEVDISDLITECESEILARAKE
ncbi:MAG: DUF2240 family protein [Thermoplasmata archaeon]